MKDALFYVSVAIFMVCSIIMDFRHHDSIEGIKSDVTYMQKQMDTYENALLTAEKEKKKVEIEYAETKKSLQRLVKDYGLSDLALPDDVIRLLKEGTTGTVDVSAPSDAAGRDKNSGTE